MSETPNEPTRPADEPTAPSSPPPPPPPGASTPPPPPDVSAPQTPPPPPPPGAGSAPYPPPGAASQPYPPQGAAGYGGTSTAAPLSQQEEKTWAMLSHGITLGATVLSSGLLGIVAAIVFYVMYKDRGPYVRAQTAAALNIQITTVIGAVISFILMFVLIGFVTIFLVGIYALVMHIIGIVKANNGEWWTPPFTPTFVR